MSRCSICGSQLDYDDYCYGDNAHQRIRELESSLAAAKQEADYYKSLVTSDQRYQEGQMDGHLACRKLGDQEIERLKPRLADAEKVFRDLTDAVNAVAESEPFKAMFVIAAIHGYGYQGPTFGKELEAARAYFEAHHG